MDKIVAIIVLFSIIKTSSYLAWNVKTDKNYLGAVGVGVLVVAVIVIFINLITDIIP